MLYALGDDTPTLIGEGHFVADNATVIGRVVGDHPGMAVARTAFGTTRVVERELGEQLPRIC